MASALFSSSLLWAEMKWKPSRFCCWGAVLSLGAWEIALLSVVSTSDPWSPGHQQTPHFTQHQKEHIINQQQVLHVASQPRKSALATEHDTRRKVKAEIKRRRQQPATSSAQNGAPQQAHNGTQAQAALVTIVNRTQRKLLEPILKAGKLFSIGRKDRSGSVITDMLYAHAFAYANQVEYAGACYTKQGYPRSDVRNLLDGLGWSHFLVFDCPDGVGVHNDILKPKAEDLSPLVIDEHLYRSSRHEYFTKPWRERLQTLVSPETGSTDVLEIAVHIRRGDVTPCRYKRRYLTNDHYLHLIDQFTPDNSKPHVTIYSESESFEPLDVFRQRGYDLQLDTDDLAQVWHALATANVVILSRSFFSFVPAAMNPNTVVYTKFFDFEPLEGWKVVDESFTTKTDKEIRRMFWESCDAEEVERARQLEVKRHRGETQETGS